MAIQYKPTTQLNLIQTIIQNNCTYSHSFYKKITQTDTNVEKLQDKAESFQKNVRKLKRYSPGGISKDMLGEQLTDLVKSYNEMESNSGQITDEDVKKQLTKLKKLFSDNEKELKKIGIENVNGKYTLDTNAFDDATDKDINALLVGHDSFIGKADKIMRKVEETADDAQYNTVEFKVNRTKEYPETDVLLAANMTLVGQSTSALTEFNRLVQSDSIANNDVKESVMTFLKAFARSTYSTVNAAGNEDAARLNQLCLDNKDKLAKVGLTFDSTQENMSFDETTDMTTVDFKTAYNELFGENGTFGKEVSAISKNVFNELIQPDKIGVSIIDIKV